MSKREYSEPIHSVQIEHGTAGTEAHYIRRKNHKYRCLDKKYRIYLRNSRTFLNQNFVSKFRVRDLCEETILRRFIMKLKCDNQ